MKKGIFYNLRLWLMPLILLLSGQQFSYAQCLPPGFFGVPAPTDTLLVYTNQGDCYAERGFIFQVDGTSPITYSFILTGATNHSTSATNPIFNYKYYNKGVTSFMLIATNACGTDTASFYIKAVDTFAPSISGPDSLTLSLNSGCSVNADTVLSNYSASDNCGNTSLSISPSTINVGGGSYTLTSVDANGNTITKNVYIKLKAPEIDVQGKAPISNNDSTPSTVDGTDFGSTAVYSGITKGFKILNTGTDTLHIDSTYITNQTNGGGFSITRMLPATIAPGRSASMDVKLLAYAANNPTADVVIKTNDCDESTYTFKIRGTVYCPEITINVPSDTVYGNMNGGCYFDYGLTGSAQSIFPVQYNFVWSGANNGSYYAGGTGYKNFYFEGVGVTKIVVQGTSMCGSYAEDSFYVKVSDNIPPSISFNSTVFNISACSLTKSQMPTPYSVHDNCGPVTLNNNAPDTFAPGSHIVRWTATDKYGNTSTKDITINVITPEIEVRGAALISNNDSTPSTSDGTDFGTSRVYTGVTKNFTVKNTGTDTLFINSASLANQTSGGGFSIDNPLPNAIAPGSSATMRIKLFATRGGNPTADVVIKTNDCDEPTYTFKIGGDIYCPSITLTMPADTLYGYANGGCYSTINVNVGGSSDFSIHYYFTFSGATNRYSYWNNTTYDFYPGITKVKVYASNACSTNYAIDSFYVKVTDNLAPYISVNSATLYISSGCSVSKNKIPTASAFDNCGGPVTISNDAPATLTVGSWTVKWTATDKYGNTRTANQTVTVVDGIKPTITAPADVTLNAENGKCYVARNAIGTPNTSDNCSVDSVWSNAPAQIPVGTHTIIWNVKDAGGNIVTDTQMVTVVDNQKPVIVSAPDKVVSADRGSCVATNVGLGFPVALSDNCAADSLWTDAPTSYPIGTTVVTLYTRDIHGNIGSDTQKITVVAPDIKITGNGVNIDKGDTSPSSSDNTDFGTVAYQGTTTKTFKINNTGDADLYIDSISLNNNTGNEFSIVSSPAGGKITAGQNADIVVKYAASKGGTHTATLVIHNSTCGNSSYDFSVKGVTTCPTMIFSVPQLAIVNNDPGVCGANYTYSVSLTSPLSTSLSYEFSGATTGSGTGSGSGNFFNVGATTIKITATNSCESVTNQAVIVVLDNQKPFIAAPSHKTAYTDNGKCYASNVSLGTPVVSDNCGVDTFWNNAPSTYPIGVTAVTWTVRDINGNINTGTQNVQVLSSQPPVITAPATVSVNADNGSCSATNVSLGTPDASAVCGIDSIWNNAPSAFPVGNTTVIWTAKDVNGAIATANQIVTVIDDQKPEIFPGTDAYAYADSGSCFATNVYLEPLLTSDNCGILSETNDAPASFPVGTTVVTWTVTDIHGNISTATLNVTVEDNQKPLLSIPPDLWMPADNGKCYATISDLGLTFQSDNCGVDSVWNNAPATFPIGDTYVTWTVKDIHGNTTSTTQNINVMDDQNPTITAPAAVTVNADNGSCAATNVLLGTPTTSDNCGVDSVWNNAPASYPVGTNSVTWTVLDIHGNTSTTTQNVTVIDNQNPDISQPIDYYGYADSGKCYATIGSFEDPTVGDNCGIASVTHNGSGTYPVGTTVLTWTVTDLHGNTNTTTQNVTIVDDQKPLLSIPPDLWMPADNGKCYATISDLGLTFQSDNCGIDSVWNNAPATFPIGDTYVTWTVKDIHGNTTSAVQSINVMDDQNPTIAISNITVNADNGSCAATNVLLGTPTTSDNCGVDSVWNNAPASYPVGTNSVTWTVLDIHGNTSTTTQTVTVIDNQKPDITAPIDVVVNADFGQCYATGVNLDAPVTGDNCGIASETNDAPASFPVGVTNVVWTVTDIHGNTNTATQTVTVIDDQNPTITSPAAVTLNADNGSCSASNVALGTPITADNCAVDSVFNNAPASFPVGTTTVTWTVIDIHGNSAIATQPVTVIDNENPTIIAPAAITLNADNGSCAATDVSLGAPVTSDNCGVDSLWNNALSSYPVGTTTVTWTVLDIHGNTSSTTQTVTVIDNQNPDITAPASVIINPDNGSCSATDVSLGTPTTADNCGVDSVWNDALSTYPTGTTTVTWTVKDIHGNMSTATQDVVVVDNQAPIVVCKNYTVVLTNGTAAISASDVDNGSTDNCGIASMTLSDSTFTCADAGDNTVVLTVTDIHGNSASCTATVTVPPAPSVTIATTPANNTYTGGNPNNIYLGYGPQSATITATGTAGTGFTYSWSPSTELSNANVPNPVFTPTAPGNYTYTVTATNSGGCTATSTVSFCVLDVQEYKNTGGTTGKIYVCITKNNGSTQTKAVQPFKVAGHLQNGDRLGKCDESCGSSAKGNSVVTEENEEQEENTLASMRDSKLKIYPNPSTGAFTIDVPDYVKGGTVIIRDIAGKQIRRTNFNPNAQLRFKLEGVADGVYIVEVHNNNEVYRERLVIRR